MKKAFTLIELLVVVAIMGILAALVVMSLSDGRLRARDAKLKTNLRNITTALEQYAGDVTPNRYPPAASEIVISPTSTATGCPANGGTANTLGGCLNNYIATGANSAVWNFDGQVTRYKSCNTNAAWGAGVILFSARDRGAKVVDGANPLTIGSCTAFTGLSTGKVYTASGPN